VQTTLLGLAITIIVAVVTALVAPLYVDWSNYRPQIEAEAARLVGVPVRVSGPIDVRLLPTPSVTLNAIEVGPPHEALRAQALGLEFSLGALVRGEWRATDMRLVGPQFSAGLDSVGRARLPTMSVAFDVDALAIERLSIEDGHAVLTDAATGVRLVLEKLSFAGEVKSLLGSFRGEGGFVSAGALYGYRVSAVRAEGEGTKIRFTLEPSDRPLTAEAEGVVFMERQSPRFEGTLTLTRPVGAVLAGGRTEFNEPMRATARAKATPAAARLEEIELQYGPDNRPLKLTGSAELTFVPQPKMTAVLTTRQIDIDRLLAAQATPPRPPAAAVRALAEVLAAVWRPDFPAALGISVETVILGGSAVQGLRGDIVVDAEGWDFRSLEFRAPGLTEMALSGRLGSTPAGMVFNGPVEVATADPRTLVAWIEGRQDGTPTSIRSLRARGEVALASGRIAVERLEAEIDRKSFLGRFAYAWPADGRRAQLDAELKAAELDIDALIAFAKAALGGTGIDHPGEIALAADIGRARIAGFDAHQAKARLRLDQSGLTIENLAIADLGGAAIDAKGRIDNTANAPRGTLTLDVDARSLSGIAALAETFAPQLAPPVRHLAERLGEVTLRAVLDMHERNGGARTQTSLKVDGKTGPIRVSLNADADGSALTLPGTRLRVDGRLASDEGRALTRLFGIERLPIAGQAPASLSFTTEGPAAGEFRLNGKLAVGAFEAAAEGTARLNGSDGPAADLKLAVANADLAAFVPAAAKPLPLSLTGKLALAGRKLVLEELTGQLAGAAMRGRLAVAVETRPQVDGNIEIDAVDAAAVIAAVAGLRQPRIDAASLASAEPFRPGLFSDASGRIAFSTPRAAFSPALAATSLHGQVRLGHSEIAFEEVEGDIAGGRLKGELVLRRQGEALGTRAQIALTGVDARALLPGGQQAPVSGRLGLKLDLDANGLSPKALIGSLGGTGAITLDEATIAGLNPDAFAVAITVVDQASSIDLIRIRDAVGPALETAPLGLPHVEAAITVAGGQARISTIAARGEGAIMTASGNLDLAKGAVDARVTLTATDLASTAAGRPDIGIALKGPIATPRKTLDISALAGWLALRSVERQAERLKEIESGRTAPATQPAPALPPPITIGPLPGSRPAPHDPAKPRSERPRPPAPAAIQPGNEAAAPRRE
jgi:large subunit ribosomal protein L24